MPKTEREVAFVDANVFLRILTGDEEKQAAAATRLVQRAMEGELTLVTNAVAMAEIVWTLGSAYKLGRGEIRERAEAILNTPGVVVDERDTVLQALDDFERENVDFADAYHAAWAQGRGIGKAYSFDTRHFGRLGFEFVDRPE